MILGFTKEIKGEKTHFAEKIKAAKLWDETTDDLFIIDALFGTDPRLNRFYMEEFDSFGSYFPKIHTFREDKHDRWKEGKIIHPYFHQRSKNCFQFAPEFPCMGTQKIDILRGKSWIQIYIDDKLFFDNYKTHDVKMYENLKELWQNDGFESVDKFFSWFRTDFHGKIIHFTVKRY